VGRLHNNCGLCRQNQTHAATHTICGLCVPRRRCPVVPLSLRLKLESELQAFSCVLTPTGRTEPRFTRVHPGLIQGVGVAMGIGGQGVGVGVGVEMGLTSRPTEGCGQPAELSQGSPGFTRGVGQHKTRGNPAFNYNGYYTGEAAPPIVHRTQSIAWLLLLLRPFLLLVEVPPR